MVAVMGVGGLLGLVAVWRFVEWRGAFELDALGTVSRDWITTCLRRG